MVSDTGVTIKGVDGVEGAKNEFQEVVQFLKDSDGLTELGAIIPRGVIIEDPTGTSKALLARAV